MSEWSDTSNVYPQFIFTDCQAISIFQLAKQCLFLQLAKQGARCDFGVFVGASSTNYSTLPQIGGKAAALKMYLNETFTTLKLDDISIWMKVLSQLTKLLIVFCHDQLTCIDQNVHNKLENYQ